MASNAARMLTIVLVKFHMNFTNTRPPSPPARADHDSDSEQEQEQEPAKYDAEVFFGQDSRCQSVFIGNLNLFVDPLCWADEDSATEPRLLRAAAYTSVDNPLRDILPFNYSAQLSPHPRAGDPPNWPSTLKLTFLPLHDLASDYGIIAARYLLPVVSCYQRTIQELVKNRHVPWLGRYTHTELRLTVKAAIRPPWMAITMPPTPRGDDLNGTWTYVEAGISKIMTDLKQGVDMVTYMNVYTVLYNFCTSQKASGPATTALSSSQRGAHLLGEEIYSKLIDYLQDHLKGVLRDSRDHSGEVLLSYYIREWNRYTTAAKYINHLFRYLNRHWVKREMDEDLFEHVQASVVAAVLKLVEKQRNGETIEQAQIKSVVDSFVSLGLDDGDPTKSILDVYRYYFERPFLRATTTYYEEESKAFVAENSVIEYMKKAEARLNEEKERVGLYLHPDILSPLMKTCQKVLIADHSALLRDEFQLLLDNDRQEDLGRMYNLLSRIPDGLDPLRTRFESHVRKAGLVAVEKVAAEGEILDPKIYVDALLCVHNQYSALVGDAFQGESEFVRSLDNACREFVNRNSVCKSGSTKSPELLAKYSDSLLKKGSRSVDDAEIESLLTDIMTVFKYIEDKDVFSKFYSKMLAKRLVHGSSTSDDAERSMISKLKEACGFEYTNKLQRMFQDIQVSKDLNITYKEWQEKVLDEEDSKKAVDPYYYILGTGFWPLSPANTTFIPPDPIVKTFERFQKFYFDKHSGRKLTWLWQLCKGEMKANYVKANKIPYTFQVSTFQMGILLLFNDADTISYEDIQKATALYKEYLDPSIAILVKAKVLLPSPDHAKPEQGTTYSLNYNFKHKKLKVNLNIAVKSEQRQEAEETHKTIEEDRKLLVQSAIVRIMKSRKKMKHVQLVQETISQIKNRFTPKIPDIKKCIDILLEKEYLERLDGEELGYLA